MEAHYPCFPATGHTALPPSSLPTGPGTNAPRRSPQQVSPGHGSPRVPRAAPPRSAHRGGCGLGWSLRGPRDGRYKSGGLRTPALPAGRGHLPAPGSRDPPGHTMTGTPPSPPRVPGSRDAAAPRAGEAPGELVNRCRLQPLTETRCGASGGFRLRHPGKARRGGACAGAHRGRTRPRGALATGNGRAPCGETPGCGPALVSALSLFLGLSSPVLLRGSRLAPRAGLGCRCHLLQSVRP